MPIFWLIQNIKIESFLIFFFFTSDEVSNTF